MGILQLVKDPTEMSHLARDWNFDSHVGLVPTMGFLHDGHLDLVRQARRQCSQVIVSIFVNPLQFGPNEDFERYPRDLERDMELLKQAGATMVFAPDVAAFTPPGMTFTIDPGPAANVLCGQYRPGHFAGVCTIVSKLFNVTRPGTAVFGWKDAQQFLILSKMVKELNIPLEMQGMETRREPDGLAMSSRNTYLTPAQRRAAPSIYKGLQIIRQLIFSDAGLSTAELKQRFSETIAEEPELQLQYIEIVSHELKPLERIEPGNTLIATAVYAGSTRLIDNIRL